MAGGHQEPDLVYLEHAIRSRNTDVLRHAADSQRHHIVPRSDTTSCYDELPSHQVIISRTTLIATIVICSIITLASIIALSSVLIKKWRSAKERRAAKSWGRQSLFLEKDKRRFSYATKGVDDSYTQQYRGVLGTAVENPEMGSDEPLEMGMGRRASLWEIDGAEKESLRVKVVDVDGMDDVDLENGAMTRKFEVVDGRVREKNGGGRKKLDGVKRKSLFWFESGGVWMPKM
ncbi:hypothetical protein Slin14017_G061200 [Septoria linicola]|nr:hypothetical protein Slin14017_G061200 [Septoria linicola]